MREREREKTDDERSHPMLEEISITFYMTHWNRKTEQISGQIVSFTVFQPHLKLKCCNQSEVLTVFEAGDEIRPPCSHPSIKVLTEMGH